MKIPSRIKVAGRTIKVRVVDFVDGGNNCGHTDVDEGIILIARKTKTKNVVNILAKEGVEQTFIHELQHCIENTYNGHVLSEANNTRLSEGWYQVIKDNPEVFK
jgi:hypothetical protein